MMSDSEIADANPRRADESEAQWIARLRRLKATMLVQQEIDAGRLVRIGDDKLIEREKLH